MTRRRTPSAPVDPFAVYLRKNGACAICRERDEARHHGAAFCAGNFRRQHPTCTHDGRKPRFVPDLAAIESAKAGT